MSHSLEFTASSVVRDALTHRVVVCFPGPGEDRMELEYAATRTEAWEFASAATLTGLSVRVDLRVRAGLRPLPCRRLWR
ncbi:hypothetical protein GPX89_38445 [Nocardia sp. ET3-3]|uniref:Uncharacterized protein n=1 Tax=Nocardia terrae TaxID=2675851 RepID=A0A7K1V952_9NOCA|nr:hypothetical protein [Nocardia terrae]MVU83106.1 hypothetical protein [Nocardia terrae]